MRSCGCRSPRVSAGVRPRQEEVYREQQQAADSKDVQASYGRVCACMYTALGTGQNDSFFRATSLRSTAVVAETPASEPRLRQRSRSPAALRRERRGRSSNEDLRGRPDHLRRGQFVEPRGRSAYYAHHPHRGRRDRQSVRRESQQGPCRNVCHLPPATPRALRPHGGCGRSRAMPRKSRTSVLLDTCTWYLSVSEKSCLSTRAARMRCGKRELVGPSSLYTTWPVTKWLKWVISYWSVIRNGVHCRTMRQTNPRARARVDAVEVVLVVHPSEVLLQDQEQLTRHRRDHKVGVLEHLAKATGSSASF